MHLSAPKLARILVSLAFWLIYSNCVAGISDTAKAPIKDPTTTHELAPGTKMSALNCADSTIAGDLCKIEPSRLHPTQCCVGMRGVARKIDKIKSLKSSPENFDKYLRSHPGKAVKGPEDKFYLVDGHHLARALLESEAAVIYLEVIDDHSNLSMADFWERMKEQKAVWLYDANGLGPKNPLHLPDSIRDLEDDPYRSLAEDAENAGAYKTVEVLFQQFYWANFYRSLIPKDRLSTDYEGAISEAVRLAKTAVAKDLPGFNAP